MKSFGKILALFLACLLILGTFAGCAAKGKTLMQLEKEKMSVNVFYLFLSRMKGNLSTSSAYGTSAYNDSFWDTLMDTSGTTYGTYYTDLMLENAKTYLAALALFEERDLKLPKETLNAIDEELEEILENEWDGSKNDFNAKLAEFGANYEILREAKIIEAKIEYLRDDLFGTDGSKIGAKLKDDYYEKNYRRFKQMFFYTYKFVTEIDQTTGEEKILTDSNGYPMTEEMTEAEIRNVLDRATEAYGKAVLDNEPSFLDAYKNGASAHGDAGVFDAMLPEKNDKGKYVYNEDTGMQTYTGGYYITAETEYDSPEVVKALFEMEVGEIRVIRSEYGIHIVRRYENEESGYAKDENADFFASFVNDLEDVLLTDYLAPYKEKVTVHEEVYATVSIKDVTPNLQY